MMHFIGSRREPFWDDFLIDRARTSAEFRIHEPILKEIVFVGDQPWEGDGCDYITIIQEEGFCRFYYQGWQMLNEAVTEHKPQEGLCICYAETRDGIHFTKPMLGIRPFRGSYETNILLGPEDGKFDNFAPFKDTNPACDPNEQYKATAIDGRAPHTLWCYTSPDGLHWQPSHPITNKGMFDSMNTAFWDECRGEYICYIRDFHFYDEKTGELLNAIDCERKGIGWNECIRDIRYITSPDFKAWSDPQLVDFGNARDYPLYTNCVQKYERTPHILIGFPNRYVERLSWTKNFDSLPGVERRAARSKIHPRYGQTTTDSLFMLSRDGRRWFRHDEAFMRPGIERSFNWVYGDCFMANGMIETESDLPHAPSELSIYTFEKHWGMEPTEFRRSTIRKDGFVSLHAGAAEKKAVTGDLVFEGDKMELNFATSALGYVYITIKTLGKEIASCELFGDSLDRVVPFEGELAAFSGQPVTIEFTLCDADIYSMRFFK